MQCMSDFCSFLFSLKAQVVSGFQSPRLSSPAPHRAGGECLICILHVQVHVVFRKGSFDLLIQKCIFNQSVKKIYYSANL